MNPIIEKHFNDIIKRIDDVEDNIRSEISDLTKIVEAHFEKPEPFTTSRMVALKIASEIKARHGMLHNPIRTPKEKAALSEIEDLNKELEDVKADASSGVLERDRAARIAQSIITSINKKRKMLDELQSEPTPIWQWANNPYAEIVAENKKRIEEELKQPKPESKEDVRITWGISPSLVNSAEFSEGDVVYDISYGWGMVTETSKYGVMSVVFERYGREVRYNKNGSFPERLPSLKKYDYLDGTPPPKFKYNPEENKLERV